MGQPVTVIEKPSTQGGVVRFEINRTLTGMGHERYLADQVVEGDRPPDELARRLFAHGGIDGIHINSNVITVHLARGGDSGGPARDHRGPLHPLPPGRAGAVPRGLRRSCGVS